MDLFEHQAKELFARYGVAIPRGRVAWSPEEAEEVAAELGTTVVVKAQVQVEEASEITAEYYVSILHDRAGKGFLAMASSQGGVEIEEVAAATPEAIVRVPVNPLVGLRPYHVNQLVFGAGFDERARKGAAEILARLYDVLLGADCT